ncbi:unnamed protein product [Rodentolepis nana]|uniref:Uncharacterized protein n=1 Tax=Rodentolepis nana TaxID=102285 RepID=A0A3P7SJT6_RODNA|nr:unnamed protein product [Rodentolepis nana]
MNRLFPILQMKNITYVCTRIRRAILFFSVLKGESTLGMLTQRYGFYLNIVLSPLILIQFKFLALRCSFY